MEHMEQGKPLPGRWVHAFEEDADGVEAYRPEDTSLPPTRGGRRILEVTADGTIIELTPGPDDRPTPTGVQFKPVGMNRYVTSGTTGATGTMGAEREETAAVPSLEVIEAGPEVLRIVRHA
jgi:hypothetical protein